ncbi:hypothetical protein DFJ74DRAFT_660580 [Hyaloraphidium curvatum]|nr:hypothetical protein DFJ74DRAFT_660580 [Hyaloraphidium curvatum]
MPKLLEFQKGMIRELLDAVPDGHAEDDPDVYDQALARAMDGPQMNQDGEAKGDGLLVTGKGLGLQRVLLTFIRIYMDPRFLVLLINTPEREADSLREALLQREDLVAEAQRGEEEGDGLAISVKELKVINNETLSSARRDLYQRGGVLAITSRILITDMLNDQIPLELVSGILVNHAHRVHETSTEAFILRLFRQKNKVGFIKAFSDCPEDFVRGMWKLEKSMKALYLRRVFLHPRFEVRIMEELESKGEPKVYDIRVPLTDTVKQIQAALIECVDACLKELARNNSWLDAEEMTVDNFLFRSFDKAIKLQLEPFWHKLSSKTKQLVEDVKTLRRLLDFLLDYDCVSFNRLLEVILTSQAVAAPNRGGAPEPQSPWLLLDAANTIFALAKKRVYVRRDPNDEDEDEHELEMMQVRRTWVPHADMLLPPHVDPVLEVQPKWQALASLLKDIEKERRKMVAKGSSPGPVLIMCEGDRTMRQLREYLSGPTAPKIGTTSREASPADSHDSDEAVEVLGSSDDSSEHSDSVDEPINLDSDEEERPKKKRSKPRRNARKSKAKRGKDGEKGERTRTKLKIDAEEDRAGKAMLGRMLGNYFSWKGSVTTVSRNLFAGSTGTAQNSAAAAGGGNPAPNGVGGVGGGRGGDSGPSRGGRPPPNKRRRVRGASKAAANTHIPVSNPVSAIGGANRAGRPNALPLTFEEEAAEVARFLDAQNGIPGENGEGENDRADRDAAQDVADLLDAMKGNEAAPLVVAENDIGVLSTSAMVVIRPYGSSSASAISSAETAGDEDSRILEDLKPQWIVLYDPDLAFVRRIELYKAANEEVKDLKVYFMVYEDSVEEQRYLSMVRREKDSFEKLIREKSNMAIPIDQDGRVVAEQAEFLRDLSTRVAGGGRTSLHANRPPLIIVDVRELRSSLPAMLHAKGIELVVKTLEVGDYVLSTSICVERKSVSDLVQSFRSGRLYTQVEAMSTHYRMPVLLIEFDMNKAFSLQTVNEVRTEINFNDIQSKLVLLLLAFPTLRILWSSSPHATADMFEDLKRQQEEPDPDKAQAIGVENLDSAQSMYAPTPQELLRSLPGINQRNARHVMNHVESIYELSKLTQDELAPLVGPENARLLHVFLHTNVQKA